MRGAIRNRGHPPLEVLLCFGSWERKQPPFDKVTWENVPMEQSKKEVEKKKKKGMRKYFVWRKVWTLKHRFSSGCYGRVYVKGLKG